MDLVIKLGMLLVFFGVMVYVGFYCRKHATDVNGFVLGGRSVGPWLTAFAYALPISPPSFSSAMPVSSAGNTALPPPGSVLPTLSWVPCWPGLCWAAAPGS